MTVAMIDYQPRYRNGILVQHRNILIVSQHSRNIGFELPFLPISVGYFVMTVILPKDNVLAMTHDA